MRLNELQEHTRRLRTRYIQEAAVKDDLEKRLKKAKTELATVEEELELDQKAQLLMHKTSEFARFQVKSWIEETVTAALRSIYGREMSFSILLQNDLRGPAAYWRVVDHSEGQVVSNDPEESRGGGVSDVVSLTLRQALLEIWKPRIRGPLLLDESGKHLSYSLRPLFGELLQNYAEYNGRQIFAVTHAKEIAQYADTIYGVKKEDGVSVATKLESVLEWEIFENA